MGAAGNGLDNLTMARRRWVVQRFSIALLLSTKLPVQEAMPLGGLV